jgi:putative transposase
MATRPIKISLEEYYHIYNRGVDKRIIFLDRQDYKRFEQLLYICNTQRKIDTRNIKDDFDRGEPLVAIGLYCMMPNHFHILVKEIEEGGISKFMLKLTTAYVMYFNKKYSRTGALFEGAFKAVHITRDQQLKYLYSYIHLNPAKLIDKNWKDKPTKSKTDLLDYTKKYKYSSIEEYMNDKAWITTPKLFPKYFSSFEKHEKELWFWLKFTDY